MKIETQIKLAGSGVGRIVLHLAALNVDWKLRWHWAGIKRELVAA